MSETILAIDAGVNTGYVVAEVHDDDTVEILEQDQFVESDYCVTVNRLEAAASIFDVTTIVTERFDLRPGNKFTADLTTVKVNAALKYVQHDTWATPVEWVEQTPAQAKSLVSNEVLKNLGWYPTGKDVGYKDANDVRDAYRHLVAFLVTARKNRWVSEGGWPR